MSPSAATLDAIREVFMDALCEVHADARAVLARVDARRLVRADPVSYTHLTLPTIYSV